MIYSTVTHFAKGNHCQFNEPITSVIARMMDVEGWETVCMCTCVRVCVRLNVCVSCGNRKPFESCWDQGYSQACMHVITGLHAEMVMHLQQCHISPGGKRLTYICQHKKKLTKVFLLLVCVDKYKNYLPMYHGLMH